MRHPFDVHVGGRLRQCRCVAGLTQQQLGDKLGIEAQQIEKYETGATRISASAMRGIAEAKKVPVTFFFVGLARALSEPSAHCPRDFVPWRFSDAGKRRAQLKRRDAASEKPAQKAT